MSPLSLCRGARPMATLHRAPTYYEAGLFNDLGQLVAVLAYDAKRTKRALLLAIYNHGPAIAELAGVDASDCSVDWKADRFTIGASGFAVLWSGFTERDRAADLILKGVDA